MMMAMTYSDDCCNCGISDDGGNDFGDGNDDVNDFNDCNVGGDDPLFIMVMTMVMGMTTMMMVGMTGYMVVTICDGGSDDDCK